MMLLHGSYRVSEKNYVEDKRKKTCSLELTWYAFSWNENIDLSIEQKQIKYSNFLKCTFAGAEGK